MFSNILINVDNLQQTFSLQGESSILQNNEIKIIASSIKGSFKSNKNVNEIEELFINDKNKLNIITKTSSMFAMKANYNKLQDTIELHENVLIIRDQETIEGEYALIDITNESYKIKSEKNKKVKIDNKLIQKTYIDMWKSLLEKRNVLLPKAHETSWILDL